MKRIVFILLLLIAFPFFSKSDIVKPCSFACYFDDEMGDCFICSVGTYCLLMNRPAPYSCYVPCECCVIVSPK